MNKLSVDTMNIQSPYLIRETEDPDYFDFFTKHKVHYSVGFMRDDSLMQSEAYHLIIVNVDNRPSPNDVAVRDTVLSVIEEFFDKNNVALLYICETGDGKQSFRSRLFERWFSAYRKKAYFTSMTSSVVDEEGITNYATIILRNDHPNFLAVVSEFTTTIQMLSQKP